MEDKAAATALLVLVVAETRNFYQWFLPTPLEIATGTGEAANLGTEAIRRNEVQATLVVVGVGVVASLMVGNAMPILGMAVAAGFMLYQYEWALKQPGTAKGMS